MMAKIPYASACGSLMYAMVATRPDIAFAVGVVTVGLCLTLVKDIGMLSNQSSDTWVVQWSDSCAMAVESYP